MNPVATESASEKPEGSCVIHASIIKSEASFVAMLRSLHRISNE